MSSEASQLLHCTFFEDSSSRKLPSNRSEVLLPIVIGVFRLSRSGCWPCLSFSGTFFSIGFGVGDVGFSWLHGLLRRTLVRMELIEEFLDDVANV